MPKNDSPCDRAREIARAVHAFAVQPGNWDELRKRAQAFIPEAAEYRQRMRQGRGEGRPWTGRTPSLAAKCALLAELHDRCLPDDRILEPAAPDGDDDAAWWSQSCAYGWIRPALKGDADSRSAERLDALRAYLDDVRAAFAASDTERAAVAGGDGESPLEYMHATDIQRELGCSYKALKRFLGEHPEIRQRKPAKNRLLVHASDFLRVKVETSRKEAETLAFLDNVPDEDLADRFAKRVEARKARAAERRKADRSARDG